MKIVVGGSMSFAKDQWKIGEKLKKKGYDILYSDNIEEYLSRPIMKSSYEEELESCLRHDIIKSFFNKIAQADNYLIVNNEKKGIRGYLGASVIMEIGVAYHLNKKIFLLNPIDKSQSYALEIDIIKPTILNGNLTKIKE